MIPVMQKLNGDCLRASVASLLELKIKQVPHFMGYGMARCGVFIRFLDLTGHDYWGVADAKELSPNDSIGGFFLASVPSKNKEDTNHAVIIDTAGLVVHDPTKDGKESYQGINVIESGDLNYCYLIQPKKVLNKPMEKWEQASPIRNDAEEDGK